MELKCQSSASLWEAIKGVHATSQAAYELFHAQHRGEAVRAQAVLEFRSRGFPIDTALLHRVYANRNLVMPAVAEKVNQTYGNVYRLNKATGAYSFYFKGLVENLKAQPMPVEWDVTKTGRLRMDEEYLTEFVEMNPYYKALLDAYFLLRHFASTDLREQLHGNFIKGLSLPFHTATGRNQPMVSRGFVLNMQPWLRSLIRPEPDHVLVACDWSQQEIVIAASLSGDRRLAAALASGDVYCALAKQAGAIPPDGNKKTHPVQRQIYKSAQLGLGYGMRANTLGKTIFLDLRAQAHLLHLPPPIFEDCIAQAHEILAWHHREFSAFWAWNERAVWVAQRDGYMRALDGWTTFCNLNSSVTRLGNFPVQANASVILRQAIKRLAKHPEIEVTCSLHDALYIYCHIDDEITHTNTLVQVMTRAARSVLCHTPMPLPIAIDTKRYTHESGYSDERDTTTLPHWR